MRMITLTVSTAASLLALGATAGVAQAAAGGGHAGTEYVSPAGSSGNTDTSCATAAFTTIGSAVAAAGSGSTVVVCRGSYAEQVVISKPLTLEARRGVLINATGQPPLKIGSVTLPGSIGIGVLGTSRVRVQGFAVTGAGFDAILVGLSSHVTVTGNYLYGNGDVGVDLNGSSHSAATWNVSEHNQGGGFLVADDIGPNRDNLVAHNVAAHNPGGCGVIVAGHSTAGVTHNTVTGNILFGNGTSKATGGGAGVVIASEVPGETVAYNTVTGNRIWGNGLAGVTLHAHVPTQHFNGNRVVGNWIGRNNLLGDPIGLATSPSSKKNVAVPDTRTTGILAATASVVKGTVIARNHIYNDHYGVFLEALRRVAPRSPVYGLRSNRFRNVARAVKVVLVPAR